MKLRYTKQKRFSHLGQIQPAGEITYSMVVKGPRAVQYEVCGAAHGSVQRESRSVTGLCPRKARWVVDYLYENAVPLEHWQAVLEDLLRQI